LIARDVKGLVLVGVLLLPGFDPIGRHLLRVGQGLGVPLAMVPAAADAVAFLVLGVVALGVAATDRQPSLL